MKINYPVTLRFENLGLTDPDDIKAYLWNAMAKMSVGSGESLEIYTSSLVYGPGWAQITHAWGTDRPHCYPLRSALWATELEDGDVTVILRQDYELGPIPYLHNRVDSAMPYYTHVVPARTYILRRSGYMLRIRHSQDDTDACHARMHEYDTWLWKIYSSQHKAEEAAFWHDLVLVLDTHTLGYVIAQGEIPTREMVEEAALGEFLSAWVLEYRESRRRKKK